MLLLPPLPCLGEEEQEAGTTLPKGYKQDGAGLSGRAAGTKGKVVCSSVEFTKVLLRDEECFIFWVKSPQKTSRIYAVPVHHVDVHHDLYLPSCYGQGSLFCNDCRLMP